MSGFERATTWTASPTPVSLDEPGELERSGTFRSPRVRGSLCEAFWGFDLCAGLPRVLSRDGVAAVRGELPRIRDFLTAEFPSLTEEALGGTPGSPLADVKRAYLGTACDLIELRHEGRTVGAIVGAPEDWSSYYVRIFAVSAAYQRPALTRRFGRECLFEPLAAHGVERLVADTSPANLAMSRTLSETRFHVTGHQLSERWGPLVRYTKFLDERCEQAFLRLFSGTAPARRPEKEETP